MDKYTVKLMPRAYRDLDEIYGYIADDLKAIDTAEHMADILEEAILSLDVMPYRGADRKIGVFSDREYRQIFIKNFTIVYRINEIHKEVIIVTVRFTPSSF